MTETETKIADALDGKGVVVLRTPEEWDAFHAAQRERLTANILARAAGQDDPYPNLMTKEAYVEYCARVKHEEAQEYIRKVSANLIAEELGEPLPYPFEIQDYEDPRF